MIETQNHGKFVYYNNLDELDKCFHIVCRCGHELYEHSFVGNYKDMLTTSQCTKCKIVNNKFGCERFYLEEDL